MNTIKQLFILNRLVYYLLIDFIVNVTTINVANLFVHQSITSCCILKFLAIA